MLEAMDKDYKFHCQHLLAEEMAITSWCCDSSSYRPEFCKELRKKTVSAHSELKCSPIYSCWLCKRAKDLRAKRLTFSPHEQTIACVQVWLMKKTIEPDFAKSHTLSLKPMTGPVGVNRKAVHMRGMCFLRVTECFTFGF